MAKPSPPTPRELELLDQPHVCKHCGKIVEPREPSHITFSSTVRREDGVIVDVTEIEVAYAAHHACHEAHMRKGH